jgi:hypothetical protein
MDRTPLDAQTYQRVRDTIVDAIHKGKDVVEELHRNDLLLTRARDMVIRLQAMNYLVRQVQSWRPAEFLRRKYSAEHSATPKDMYVCILEFLEEHVETWERDR